MIRALLIVRFGSLFALLLALLAGGILEAWWFVNAAFFVCMTVFVLATGIYYWRTVLSSGISGQ